MVLSHAGQNGVTALLRCLPIGHHVVMAYDWNGLAEAIRVERARRKWSQADLGTRVGVTQGTIKNLESGKSYKRPPVQLLRGIDHAFEWPEGTLERKLSGETAETAEAEVETEADLATRYRREPAGPDQSADMIHSIVYKVVGTVAPGTSLAEFQALEAEALEIAARYGIVPARRDQDASGSDSRETREP